MFSGQNYVIQTGAMGFDAPAALVQSVLSATFKWSIVVNRLPLYKNGSVITNPNDYAQSMGFLWQINFTQFRVDIDGVAIQPKVDLVDYDPNQNPQASFIQTQAPSSPLDGTILLEYKDLTSDHIPVTSTSAGIANVLSKIPGIDKSFFVETIGDPLEDHTYIFSFNGLSDVPLISFQTWNVSGGDPSWPTTISARHIVRDNSNIFYSPVPSNLLYTRSKIFLKFAYLKMNL